MATTQHAVDSMEKRMERMFNVTWEAVASDWLEACPRQRCKGAEVQEAVADAGRYKMYGEDKEAAVAWDALDRAAQDKLLNKWFPRTKTYGY